MISEEDRAFVAKCMQKAREAINKTAEEENIDLAFYKFEIKAILVSSDDYTTPLHIIEDRDG